ncbi:AAA family ATPase [Kangiella koreensis]|uniref:ATPase associated with various cellular activities AAA_3 n=1 Tax=Kangiella koreensis (strain DSM 16069 / JCM 12317 / KCTC 12182 / SW-125) TaxID=523791 RepID=C7R6G2_KANKD|nr:MoxR family ATPase [Kangiella koreensis]ACV27390.1 ATPase associated with various cellular activities AAA_3 [Kangiella koreensis DSM 16069]
MSIKQQFIELEQFLKSRIIGQHELVHKMLIALLADGHLLVEGAPGLAKTRAIKELSTAVEGDFHRIQFTPDLLPADLTGTEIYRPQEGTFHFQKGPLFHNMILADEINRAPAKVQSALLEAMAERQITVGSHSFALPELFLVMATQNPIEQEGTYPLPEAQLDRFLMQVIVDYPDTEAEAEILALNRQEALTGESTPINPLSQQDLFVARKEVLSTYMAPEIEEYLVQLIISTRQPEKLGGALASYIEYGASPRATIALDRCARANAWLNNRDYVTPGDVQTVLFDILRHRIILSYQAEAEGVTADAIIDELIKQVPTP